MATADERDRVPYPVDIGLIQEAQMIGNGMYVHDINRSVSEYENAAKAWERSWDTRRWYVAVDKERILRGTVAAAKANRPFHAPWATR